MNKEKIKENLKDKKANNLINKRKRKNKNPKVNNRDDFI